MSGQRAQSIVVAGLGRCGTTAIYDALRMARSQEELLWLDNFEQEWIPGGIYKTHTFPPAEKPAVPCRVLFLFGDPVLITVSAHRQPLTFLEGHYQHLAAEFEHRYWYLYEDTLRLEHHFDAWNRPQVVPTLMIRYECLQENLNAVRAFVGFDFPFVWQSRETSIATLSVYEQRRLRSTFARLTAKIDAAPDLAYY